MISTDTGMMCTFNTNTQHQSTTSTLLSMWDAVDWTVGSLLSTFGLISDSNSEDHPIETLNSEPISRLDGQEMIQESDTIKPFDTTTSQSYKSKSIAVMALSNESFLLKPHFGSNAELDNLRQQMLEQPELLVGWQVMYCRDDVVLLLVCLLVCLLVYFIFFSSFRLILIDVSCFLFSGIHW